jgi:hypothetical protein
MKEPANRRVLEKLEIERLCWLELGVDWEVAADKSISSPGKPQENLLMF